MHWITIVILTLLAVWFVKGMKEIRAQREDAERRVREKKSATSPPACP